MMLVSELMKDLETGNRTKEMLKSRPTANAGIDAQAFGSSIFINDMMAFQQQRQLQAQQTAYGQIFGGR